MENVFNQIISSRNNQKEIKYGDPWNYIPIKNNKGARETTEIFMGNQNLQGVVNFDKFPNLEVLWINNNQFEKLEGLEPNFRIKFLYAYNNKLKTLDGSISKFKHLDTLALNNNELRGLDSVLTFLKQFTLLKNLDLFNNPLAEEPNYRFKVILALPQLELFDRQRIEIDQIRKAKKWQEKQAQKYQMKKKQTNIKPKVKVSNQFSENEKVLYREAENIRQRQIREQKEEEERVRLEIENKFKVTNTEMPKPVIPWQDIQQKAIDANIVLIDEYDKNKLKVLFRSFDKDKKKQILVSDFGQLLEKMKEDEGMIAKVPKDDQDALALLKPTDDKLTWDSFITNINQMGWKYQDKDILEDRIKQKYYLANKLRSSGQDQQAVQQVHMAIRLQNLYQRYYENQEINFGQSEQKKDIMRKDYYDMSSFQFRGENTNREKQVV